MDLRFENDVKMYGIQTGVPCEIVYVLFENDVKMYGIQTDKNRKHIIASLRMM